MQTIILFVHHWKKELLFFSFAFLCLFLAVFFPASGAFQLLSRFFLFLVVLPILFIKFILHQKLADFGWNMKNPPAGFSWMFFMLLISFLILMVFFYFFNFAEKYQLPAEIIHNFWGFVFYEMVLVNFLLFALTFFLHGFFQSKLEFSFKKFSPLVQFFIFAFFLIATKKLSWQYAPLLTLSLTGGITAYYGKSFWYSYILGMLFTISLDLYIIELVK